MIGHFHTAFDFTMLGLSPSCAPPSLYLNCTLPAGGIESLGLLLFLDC